MPQTPLCQLPPAADNRCERLAQRNGCDRSPPHNRHERQGNGLRGVGDTITLGNGKDTVYAGAGDTITLGSGNDLVLFGVNPSPSIVDSEIGNGFNPKNI
jgi:hypothetical protein